MADEYTANAVKQHPELPGWLTQKTGLPDPKAWRVFRPDAKPHFVTYEDIETWLDLVPATSPSEPEV